MPNKAIWINLNKSKLGRLVYISIYTGLALAVLAHPNPQTNWLLLALGLHGWWSWQQAFGRFAPQALLLYQRKQGATTQRQQRVKLQLATGELLDCPAPLLMHSRYVLVFKPLHPYAWPWLVWPDAVTPEEHHQLRYFLSGWHQ